MALTLIETFDYDYVILLVKLMYLVNKCRAWLWSMEPIRIKCLLLNLICF